MRVWPRRRWDRITSDCNHSPAQCDNDMTSLGWFSKTSPGVGLGGASGTGTKGGNRLPPCRTSSWMRFKIAGITGAKACIFTTSSEDLAESLLAVPKLGLEVKVLGQPFPGLNIPIRHALKSWLLNSEKVWASWCA